MSTQDFNYQEQYKKYKGKLYEPKGLIYNNYKYYYNFIFFIIKQIDGLNEKFEDIINKLWLNFNNHQEITLDLLTTKELKENILNYSIFKEILNINENVFSTKKFITSLTYITVDLQTIKKENDEFQLKQKLEQNKQLDYKEKMKRTKLFYLRLKKIERKILKDLDKLFDDIYEFLLIQYKFFINMYEKLKKLQDDGNLLYNPTKYEEILSKLKEHIDLYIRFNNDGKLKFKENMFNYFIKEVLQNKQQYQQNYTFLDITPSFVGQDFLQL